MKILLFGEYSNFHNSLKKGLNKLGHTVVLASRKDGFKSYPVDISFDPVITIKKPLKYIRSLVFRICKFDIAIFEIIFFFLKHKRLLKDFDVVQLINEYPIKSTPFFDRLILNFIFKHNKKVFVSACGDDVTYLNFILNSSLEYHILTPYLNYPHLKNHFKYSLDYLKAPYKKLSNFVLSNVDSVIPADLDYYMAYKNHPKTKPLIPFPINIDSLKYTPLKIENKIKIFHGINRINFYKKGNDYFCKALEIIKKKYSEQIIITEVENIPYKDYISLYNDSHILLDQVYSYDQGYNALEAMAKGKVVFTGVSKEFLEYYQIDNQIAINAIPDVKSIVDNLSFLIENPSEIINISKNARNYIVQFHDYKKVAKQYLECWKS